MNAIIPDGYRVRPPEDGDIPAIIRLLTACDLAEYGQADAYTEDDIG